jgi:hypothetical protein
MTGMLERLSALMQRLLLWWALRAMPLEHLAGPGVGRQRDITRGRGDLVKSHADRSSRHQRPSFGDWTRAINHKEGK